MSHHYKGFSAGLHTPSGTETSRSQQFPVKCLISHRSAGVLFPAPSLLGPADVFLFVCLFSPGVLVVLSSQWVLVT